MVLKVKKEARDITFKRQEFLKDKKLNENQKITLEGLYSQIDESFIKELNIIIKSDVQGSLEALRDSLAKIPTNKARLKFIHLGVGDVNSSDILLAAASKAVIIAFHVGIETRARKELEKEPVDIREYRIIYDVVNDMKDALEGLLEAKGKKNFVSRVEIKEVFKLSKSGIIAGCIVLKGKVNRKVTVDIVRGEEVVHTGKISSLKRFKDDVKEVTEGMECGISIESFNEIQAGDIIEAYDVEMVAQKL
jgi:translation initiation factor IF-2